MHIELFHFKHLVVPPIVWQLVINTCCGFSWPPTILSLEVNRKTVQFSAYSIRGDDLSLKCVTHGASTVEWRRNKTQNLPQTWLKREDGSLIVLLGRETFYRPEEHEGYYECVARNEKEYVVSTPLNIILPVTDIEYKDVLRNSVLSTWRQGQTAVFNCNSSNHLTYYPNMMAVKPKLVWHKFHQPYTQATGFGYRDVFGGGPEPQRLTQDSEGRLYIRDINTIDQTQPNMPLCCSIRSEYLQRGSDIRIGCYRVQVTTPRVTSITRRLLQSSGNQSVLMNEWLILSCVFDEPSSDYKYVTWRKTSGHELQRDVKMYWGGTRLEIERAGPYHDGNYECSYPGTSQTSTINVIVVRPPPINASLLQDTYVIKRATAWLTCQVDDHLRPSITWFLKGQPVTNSSKVQTYERSAFENVLAIKNVTTEDEGTVTCIATNRYGTAILNARIFVYDKPSVAVRGEGGDFKYAFCCLGNSYQLTCSAFIDARSLATSVKFTINNRQDVAIIGSPENSSSAIEIVNATTFNLNVDISGLPLQDLLGHANCTIEHMFGAKVLVATSSNLHILPLSDCPMDPPTLTTESYFILDMETTISCTASVVPYHKLVDFVFPYPEDMSSNKTKVYTSSYTRATAIIIPLKYWSGSTIQCRSQIFGCSDRISSIDIEVNYIELKVHEPIIILPNPEEDVVNVNCSAFFESKPNAAISLLSGETQLGSQATTDIRREQVPIHDSISDLTCVAHNGVVNQTARANVRVMWPSPLVSPYLAWCTPWCWYIAGGVGGLFVLMMGIGVVSCTKKKKKHIEVVHSIKEEMGNESDPDIDVTTDVSSVKPSSVVTAKTALSSWRNNARGLSGGQPNDRSRQGSSMTRQSFKSREPNSASKRSSQISTTYKGRPSSLAAGSPSIRSPRPGGQLRGTGRRIIAAQRMLH